MIFHSIRARLTAWYATVLAVTLVAAGAITYAVAQRQIQLSTDAAIASSARNLTASLVDEASELGGALPASAIGEILTEYRENDSAILILSPDGRELAAHATPLGRAVDRELLRQRFAARAFGFATLANGLRLYLTPLPIGSETFAIAIVHSAATQEKTLRDLRQSMYFTLPLALLVASLGGYFLARKSLAPVSRINAKARAIGATNLSERVEVDDPRDELGELAATLNDLLGRLEQSFSAQRRFMADASHELRSPVAILQGELDVTLSRDDRDAADYRESLAVMRRSVRRLTRIVRDLFLLARSDAGDIPLKHELLDLDDFVSQTVRGYRTLAAEQGVALGTECAEDIVIDGDEDLLQRMLGNLIENALRYTPRGEEIRIVCTSMGNEARIEVHDRGPGVPEHLHEEIFGRFFRVDPARSATAGSGAGLGLPIARWIAAAHGGVLWLERSDASGSVFVAILPRHSSSV
ncbi:MAG: HAMP domain-containing protein [Acidobacteria bacterium]|nr:HAMP domain-containing protein [Acidobacteriota bacterium]